MTCKNQHTRPCKTCPFWRDVKPGTVGASLPQTYIGQIYGGFWLPCHSFPDYGKDPSAPHCAGAAIFRSNVNAVKTSYNLDLPADTTLSFASYEEFLAHHLSIPIGRAAMGLRVLTPPQLAAMEMRRNSTFMFFTPKDDA